jgi:hypothetical protein
LRTLPGENIYDQWITVPGGSLNHAGAVVPPEGQGNWKHFYYEMYIQFAISSAATPSDWPGAFAWSIEGLGNFDFGSPSWRADPLTEWDFFESEGAANFSNLNGVFIAALARLSPSEGEHYQPIVEGYPTVGEPPEPNSVTVSDGVKPYFDSECHTAGGLWEPDPANPGQGLISSWFHSIQYAPKLTNRWVGQDLPGRKSSNSPPGYSIVDYYLSLHYTTPVAQELFEWLDHC